MNNLDQINKEFNELQHIADDVQESNYQTIDDNIGRFSEALSPENALGKLLSEVLPKVDFTTWYSNASSASTLNWPKSKEERVSMQVELIRYISQNPQEIFELSLSFLVSDSSLEVLTRTFLRQIFRPFYRDLTSIIDSNIRHHTPAVVSSEVVTQQLIVSFVAAERIEALRSVNHPQYNLSKLIRLCEELNICHENRCFYAIAMITRSIIDHVPPIFGFSSFSEVANNYSGPKSFRDSMSHLSGSARKIGDTHLHVPIRAKEVLPTATQVNFSNDLDVLLAEIVRVLS